MPTPIETHWDSLLEPISDDMPSGESLLYEGTYDQIREARRQDLDLPQGDWQHELKKADWREVENLCVDALRHKTKDYQIVCWLTEAMVHRHGHTGLRDGLGLLLHLSQQYWDTAWPELEDDDVELRIAPFIWLNEKLINTLTMELDITAPSDDDAGVYNYYSLERARSGGRRQEDGDDNEEDVLTYAKFLHSVSLTPSQFYKDFSAAFTDTQDTIDQLNQFLDEKCGNNAPGLSRLKKAVTDIHDAVKTILSDTNVDVTEDDNTTEASEEITEHHDVEVSTTGSGNSGPIRSRQEAYRRLAEAADYLLRTEPHSPTPYLVKRAVSWGNMSLNELLNELVNDEHDLQAIYVLLGMRTPE